MISFCRALRQLGFEAELYPVGSPVIHNNAYDIMFNGIKENDNNYDYIILCGACHKHFEAVADYCIQYKKKLIYWVSEDPIYYTDNDYLIRHADIILSPAIECVEKYKLMGKNAYLFMFGTDPEYHVNGIYNSTYACDIMAQFSYYNWQNRLNGYKIIMDSSKQLTHEGYTMQLWGAFWDTDGQYVLGQDYSHIYKGYMPNEALPDVCKSSKIVLGVQCCNNSKTQQSMRSFEILGCGGFHLCQWTPSMDYWFENGKHLIAVKSKEEAIDLIKYYLVHSEERHLIAEQGQNYVYSEHTYKRRIENSFLKDL
jgi:spore maturation protein CgeB